jgi:membrane-associated HD superfamily phosphohydrolase
MEVESKSAAGQTVWTASQSTFVHTFLANFIEEGLKTSTGFKKVHLNKCAEALNEKFKLNRTGDHIGNHLKTLRRRYVKINQLRSLSGALWDEDQYIISLDHEHYRNHFEVKMLLPSSIIIAYIVAAIFYYNCIYCCCHLLINILFIDRILKTRVMMNTLTSFCLTMGI